MAAVYYVAGTSGWSSTYDGFPTEIYNVTVPVPPSPLQFYYTTNSVAATIIAYKAAGGSMNIPAALNGLPVTSIGDNAFYFCSNVTSVTIPSSVSHLGANAFANCAILGSVSVLLVDRGRIQRLRHPLGKPRCHALGGIASAACEAAGLQAADGLEFPLGIIGRQ
jgi:hypothetical protein